MTSDLAEFRLEQFKTLAEEKRSIDRYMWQLPMAVLGIVALALNVIPKFLDPFQPVPVSVILLCAGLLAGYAALILGRFHQRRECRESFLIELEKKLNQAYGSGSDGFQSTIRAEDHPRRSSQTSLINAYFGWAPTSSASIALLLWIAAVLVGAAVLVRVPVQGTTLHRDLAGVLVGLAVGAIAAGTLTYFRMRPSQETQTVSVTP